jgi:hypothetical protein
MSAAARLVLSGRTMPGASCTVGRSQAERT